MNIEIDTDNPKMADVLQNLKNQLEIAISKDKDEIENCTGYLDIVNKHIEELEKEAESLRRNKDFYLIKIKNLQTRKEASEQVLKQINDKM